MGEQGKQPISQLDPSVWVDRHGDVLCGYALARLRDPEAAEEVVQETFVSALRAVAQYSGEGAWLLGILKRKIVDHVRRRSRFDAAVGGGIEHPYILIAFIGLVTTGIGRGRGGTAV